MTATLDRSAPASAAAPPERAARRGVAATLLRVLRTVPAALTITALIAVCTLAATAAGWGTLRLGASPIPLLAGEWWRALAPLVIPPSALWLPLLLPVVLVAVGYAERRLGSATAAAVYLATGLAGALGGSVAQAALDGLPRLLPGVDLGQAVLDPTAAVSGTLIAASFASGPLWRRRIRVVVISAAVLAVVYGGGAADLHRLAAALSGFAVGAVLVHRFRPRRIRSSHRELRSLLAAVVALTAAGPLVAIAAHSRIGPLAPLAAVLAEGCRRPRAPAWSRRRGRAARSWCCSRASTTPARSSSRSCPWSRCSSPPSACTAGAGSRCGSPSSSTWRWPGSRAPSTSCSPSPLRVLPGLRRLRRGPGVSAVVSTAVPLVVAALLLLLRGHFPVRGDRRAVRRYAVLVGASLVALCALYVGGGALLADGWTPRATVAALLADLPERFVPAGYVSTDVAEFLPTTAATRLLFHWTGPALWLIALVGAVPLFFGSSRAPQSEPAAQVRRLLRQEGGNSIGHMGTWPGNSQWVSPAGDAAVAFRVVSGVALTVGGPICAPHRRLDAVSGFARHCYEQGWLPCFYSLREEDYAEVFATLGWTTVRVGEEMVLDPRGAAFTGRGFQVIRTSVNGASRLGIEALWTRYRDLSLPLSLQVREISEQWVAEKGLPEMGFTLGGLNELDDPDVRLLVAVSADGVVHGFTSWLPRYRDGVVVGWTLDVMRRRADGFPRVMEFLIATAVTRLGKDGIDEVSLAAAPLASSTPTAAAGVLDVLARALEPAYGFRSLFVFKSKFRPRQLPLVVATPDALTLPVVARAVLRAYLPQTSTGSGLRLLRALWRRVRAGDAAAAPVVAAAEGAAPAGTPLTGTVLASAPVQAPVPAPRIHVDA